MQEIEFTVNDHFNDFIEDWNYKNYFLVGGYGSSKSYHVATKILLKLLEEKRKCLVVREVFDTHRDSTYSLFMEIADKLGIDTDKCFKSSPLGVKFPNGSTIIFKGMDKPAKLKSINDVSIIWLEECSEVKYEGYKELLGRLRHMKASNHIICSTNPIDEGNWTYTHFFKDEENGNIVLDDNDLYNNRIVLLNNTYYHHSTCEDNFYLPSDYIEELNNMKTYDPDLYRVARLGRYGVNGVKVLPQFEVMEHEKVIDKIKLIHPRLHRVGLDLGFVTSYNSLVRVAIDEVNKHLYIYDEYYSKGITDDIIATDILNMNIGGKIIYVDSSEPKTIAYLQQRGIKAIPCKKFAGSVLSNIKKIKRFKKIYCSTNCKNAIRELKTLTYKKDRKGNIVENEFNIDSHIFDSIAYSLDGYEVADIKQFNRSKYGI